MEGYWNKKLLVPLKKEKIVSKLEFKISVSIYNVLFVQEKLCIVLKYSEYWFRAF